MRNSRTNRYGGALIVVSMLLSACTAGDQSVHESPLGLWSKGESWHLIEQARIGSTDGDGPESFSNVVEVTLDPLGRVWVADAQENELRVFDATGKHVRSIGRKGAGPTEFNGIAGLAWGPGGKLWVVDSGNARFAVYDTAGNLVTTHLRNSIMTSIPWPGRFDRRGRLYDVAGTLDADGDILTSIVRLDTALQPRDTFPLPPFESEVFEIKRGNAANQTITQVGVPFAGTQIWNLDPDGFVWVANSSHYRIERHGFDSVGDRRVERSTSPVRIPARDREQMLDRLDSFVRQGGKVDLGRIPDNYPALGGFLFDDTGRLWVSPTMPPRDGRAMDVFERDGRYLGRVVLPTGMRSSPRVIRDDRMVVVARDSLDVESVILLRIVKPGG